MSTAGSERRREGGGRRAESGERRAEGRGQRAPAKGTGGGCALCGSMRWRAALCGAMV